MQVWLGIGSREEVLARLSPPVQLVRRLQDHFFGRVCFSAMSLFTPFGSFFFVLTSDFQFIYSFINNAMSEPHRRHCVVVLEQDTFILA